MVYVLTFDLTIKNKGNERVHNKKNRTIREREYRAN